MGEVPKKQSFTAWRIPSKGQSWCRGEEKMQNSKFKMQNAQFKIQIAKALLLGNSPVRTKVRAKVEENRNCKNSKYKMECSLQLLFVQNTNSKLEMQNAKKQVSLLDGSQVRARAGAKVEENRNCTTLTFLTNTNQTNIVALYLRGGGYKIILLDNN